MNISRLFKMKRNENEENILQKHSFRVLNEHSLEEQKEVAVVVPVYNAEKYLNITVDSVIKQNFGFHRISLILVDDCSTDSSREILNEYASLYENITVVLLDTNTGTPAHPRNLGIELANAKYITFLDADDWFAPNGILSLYNILEESQVNYAVGKTIQVEAGGQKIIGKYESVRKRLNISPLSIPHIFYHLGPRARMMRLDFIRDHKIRFPEMKFAEDKQFFMDVLFKCEEISTTTDPIYYLNRMDDNNESLTKQTNIIEKTDSNIAVMKYVLRKKLDQNIEKMAINRLIEFDSITRLFDRHHFLKSENKEEYFEKFREILGILKKTKYDISETFFKPLHKIAFDLLKEKRYEEVEQLFRWSKKQADKKIVIKGDTAYYEGPLKDEKYKLIEIPLHAEVNSHEFHDDVFVLNFAAYGKQREHINGIQFQHRETAKITHDFNVTAEADGSYRLKLTLDELAELRSGGYVMYLVYNDYERINIIKQSDVKSEKDINQKSYTFYKTVKGNISLKIK
ncbi:glycosyltransferase family 2 protein [Bacillus sonorensis]|uniref:Minor teichoic acid biosynthesis protein ggaA like protein n=2 Tax=Bacillus sonorensis TaxID=119858 RepID=M5PBX8_9BACI|nr:MULTISPECIES: glycosyltransferase family 2 protein [Bacillus]TWK80564.1 putative teichuronic acid biosynthesis glycosyltransferase TuaG [Bacillus paralicheniformis]ASB87145.1 CDP-glycerol glycerophosphotransferase [Bacillus sonorensis]EME73375.1 minor teichoic acid biosynthesis protein ggaA like protein [Bacillus sonorensis L12]MBG9914361.1 glycosyl transferase [Bacillus sonorensis]MCF7616393.1 glycosyltransferase family 2 protein [Bacillus sonorensis]